MLDYWLELGNQVLKRMGHMDRNEWLIVFGVVLVIGFVCMRGFGSRTSY